MPLAPFPEDWQSALCVAAHPDDLEYGLAAAVARWTAQGKSVTYLLATRGEAGIDGVHPDRAAPLREQEERAGAAVVGVDVVDFLGLPDGAVEYGLPLRRALADLLDDGPEPWPGVRWIGMAGSPQPTHAVDVSATLEAGIRSLEAHQDYLAALGEDYPSPRDLLGTMLDTTGDPDLGRYTLALEADQR